MGFYYVYKPLNPRSVILEMAYAAVILFLSKLNIAKWYGVADSHIALGESRLLPLLYVAW